MTKKTLVKKIKSFLKPSDPEENSPDLAAALTKLTERMEALELKTDQVLSRLASLPSAVRNAIQPNPRPHAPQVQNFPRATPSQPVRPAAQPPRFVQGGTPPSSVPSGRPGRRDRALFKAICADCGQDCEVPVKSTEGRPVYCKPCFALRKAAKTLPIKTPDRVAAVGTMQKMPSRVPSPQPVPPQAVTPAAGVPGVRSSGHVPPQIHNLARRSAVAYLAKKAGHVPNPQSATPQIAPASAAPSSSASAAKSVRPKSLRNDRARPKKRSR